MSSRGVYRGGYSALLNDPDFRRLSAGARHTLLTMRWSEQVGIACIWLLEPATLAKQTGYPVDVLEGYLAELSTSPSTTAPWLLREGELAWIRNGLRYDPTVNLVNAKHKRGVERAVAALPRSRLLARFCRYYDLPYPYEGHRQALRRPSESPSIIPVPSPVPKKTESESDARARATDARDPESSHELASDNGRRTASEPTALAKLAADQVAKLKRKEGRPAW